MSEVTESVSPSVLHNPGGALWTGAGPELLLWRGAAAGVSAGRTAASVLLLTLAFARKVQGLSCTFTGFQSVFPPSLGFH